MRARLSADRWRTVIPYLDRALDLTEDERTPWLASLHAEDPALADDLESLLEKRAALAKQGFLEEGPDLGSLQTSLAGQVIGAYTLRSQIGQGGMGSVWLAERSDGRYQGLAAVKLLNPSLVGRDGEVRFRREGSVLARLRHPHIAHLIDAGLSPLGQPYLVLEHVDGEHIDRYCDARSMGVEARIRLFLDVLVAVAHAHANLVVHRDLKPSNVLVAADGQVKLLDFGIAKLLESETGSEVTALTREGGAVLTPEYAAPEQLTAVDITTATDVYSLGVLLYVLLTGRHPAGKEAGSPAELIRAIVDTEPVRASEAVTVSRDADAPTTEVAARRATTPKKLRSALRGDLDNIVAKALRKRPAERYASAEAMADDLRRYLRHEPVSAQADSLAYRAAKFLRRHRLGVAAAGLALLAAGGFAAAMAVQAARIAREAEAKRRVSEFLTELFKVSDPRESGGNSITARELLDKGAARIRGTLADDSGVRAELMATMGTAYSGLGLYAQAEPLLNEALETRRRLEPDGAATLRLASEVAQLFVFRGRYKEAEARYSETLAAQKRVLGSEHPDTLRSMAGLATTYSVLSRIKEAEALRRETLDIQKRVLGPEHPDTLASMNSLANAFAAEGRYAETEMLHRQVLEIRRRILGPEHPDTLQSMTNVAWSCWTLDRHKEAEAIHRETLEIQKRVLGPQHPGTLASMDALASTYNMQGRHSEAESLQRETVEIQRRVLGPEHLITLGTLSGLANTYWALRRFDEAEALRRDTLEVCERVVGPEHPLTLALMHGLADAHRLRGRYAEAVTLDSRTLEIHTRLSGPRNSGALLSLYGLARTAALQGHRAEALRYLRDAVGQGFSDAKRIVKEADLASLRGDRELEGIVASARQNRGATDTKE